VDISIISVLILGFILGIKHSIEPDHIIAVSTMVSRSRRLLSSTLTGVFWGIGHTATLFLVGMILVIMKGELSEKWAMSLEFLVGIMLVYLGIKNIISIKESYNPHHDEKSSLLRITFIGFIHGLAGSAAMVLLTMSTVTTVWECAIYILIFGAGTILGMLSFTTILGIPFLFSKKNLGVNKGLTQLAGTVSFIFGIYYMYNLGIAEGLFKMWIQ
jgi:hypothetical protein